MAGQAGVKTIWQRRLDDPKPTPQKAELEAITLALEKGLEKSKNMNNIPRMDVKIFINSQYAVDVMTIWKRPIVGGDFTDSTGRLLDDRDLMRKAYSLQEELEHEGNVEIGFCPKRYNWDVDVEVREVLDMVQQGTWQD